MGHYLTQKYLSLPLMRKVTRVNEVTKFFDSINCIDYGGCGIAVLAMYLHLKKYNMHHNFVLLALSNTESNHEHNLAYVQGKLSRGRSTTHFAYEIDYVLYRPMITDFELRIENNVEEFLTDIILNSVWNDAFDRKKYCPLIEQTLKIKLPKGTY